MEDSRQLPQRLFGVEQQDVLDAHAQNVTIKRWRKDRVPYSHAFERTSALESPQHWTKRAISWGIRGWRPLGRHMKSSLKMSHA